MKTMMLPKEITPINTIGDVPAVSIIMPFEPMMSSKQELQYKLKRAAEKVESALLNQYSGEKVFPVMQKLMNLLASLNYNTHKKSIAIFVSLFIEAVYYLDIAVEERIATDEMFDIRDLINSKKRDLRYLVLLLSSKRSRMYEGNCSKFVLIKSNAAENIVAFKNDIAERINFSNAETHREILLDKFLHRMDEDLTLILNAYNLPVFVLAPEKIFGHFKKITCNAEKLVAFINGNYDDATETEIRKALQPYLKNWGQMKQQAILQELEKARDVHKLSFGMHEVQKISRQNNSRLLIVEKDFVFPAGSFNPCSKIPDIVLPIRPFYIKDTVDSVIEKVLQNGGDVEFVENNVLEDYGRIAMIRYY